MQIKEYINRNYKSILGRRIGRTENFNTVDELYNIPWIKNHTDKEDPHYLTLYGYRKKLMLIANDDEGRWYPVGFITPIEEAEKLLMLPKFSPDVCHSQILSDMDRDILINALANPPEPNQALKDAFSANPNGVSRFIKQA